VAAGIVSNIAKDIQLRLLQILNDDVRGPLLRKMLKGDPAQHGELAAVGGISELVAAQLKKAVPSLQKVREVLTLAQSLLSTEDDESMLAAALATIAVQPQATHTDELRSTLVPFAKRMGGDAAESPLP
jgi:hypothetical protein